MNKLFLFIVLLSFHNYAVAGFNGSIQFSESEKAAHLRTLPKLLSVSSQCLTDSYAFHKSFFARYGISPFYGDSSEFSEWSYRRQKEYLREQGLPPEILDEMIPSSCVGFAMRCLKKGFEAAGQPEYWSRIVRFAQKNGVDGTAIQTGLQALGWKLLYWMPDTSRAKEFDRWERENYADTPAEWGYHANRLSQVRNSGMYYNSRIDDARTLVDFNTTVPARVLNAPLFVATAHAGYHVFSGTNGVVVEGHSSDGLSGERAVESAPFNPLDPEGGPNGNYFSGMLALPPGY